MLVGYLNLLLIMFRGLSSGKFIQLYEVFGTGPLMPDTLSTFRALLDQPFPKHWRAKVPQQQPAMPGAHPAAASIASLTLEVQWPDWNYVAGMGSLRNGIISVYCKQL